MCARRPRRGFRAARFDERHGLAGGPGSVDRTRETRGILDALDVEPKGRDALILRQQLDHVLDGEPRLIAHRQGVTDRDRPGIEQQTERDRAALADERDTALGPAAYDLIRPQRRALEEVDEAVAVRAEERQLARARDELAGQALPLIGCGLGKPRRKAHESSRPAA